jgi:hypothetical protein
MTDALQDAAMTEQLLARLSGLEANVNNLITAQTELRGDLKALVASLAELAAELRHPSKDHCVMADAIADAKQHASATDARVSDLEHRAARAEGAGRVLLWLLGAGNLAGIGALIAWLLKLAGA